MPILMVPVIMKRLRMARASISKAKFMADIGVGLVFCSGERRRI